MESILELNQYQELAGRTSNPALDSRDRLATAALGFAGEAGEVADLVKKHFGHGHELNRTKLIEEVGDCLWYIAEIADCLEISLSDLATGNITKLAARYPQGFSTERSVNRD